ncbi:MAG: hypothetical protein ACE5G8_11430, partial [Anaerolineae bacterium]
MKITFGLPGRVAFKGWGKTVALLVLFTLPVTLVWGFAGQKSAYSLFQSPLQTSPVATPTPKPPPPPKTPLPPGNPPPHTESSSRTKTS